MSQSVIVGLYKSKSFTTSVQEVFLKIYGFRKNYSIKNSNIKCDEIKPHIVLKLTDNKNSYIVELTSLGYSKMRWPGRYSGKENVFSWVDYKFDDSVIDAIITEADNFTKKQYSYNLAGLYCIGLFYMFGIKIHYAKNDDSDVKSAVCGEAIANLINEAYKKNELPEILKDKEYTQFWEYFYLGKIKPKIVVWKVIVTFSLAYTIGLILLPIISFIYIGFYCMQKFKTAKKLNK
ncbi:MAG: hypothetical protein IPO21_05690 [Bacteroidales bacterium]|nr:hypothetical protein [Bacteroidales bacterium]